MQKVVYVCCVNQHPATEFCSRPSCPHPSPICEQPECEYSKIHQPCTYIKSRSLNQKLIKNREIVMSKQQTLVIGTLNNIIKDIEIFKSEYLNQRQKSNQNSQSYKNCQKLEDIISNRRWRDIKPKMIHDLTNDAFEPVNQPKLQENKLTLLRSNIQKILQEFRDKLSDIKKVLKSFQALSSHQPINTFYKFRNEDIDQNVVQIFNNQKSIRQIEQKKISYWNFHYITFSYEYVSYEYVSFVSSSNFQNQIIRLKLVKNASKKVSLGITTGKKTRTNNILRITSILENQYCPQFKYQTGDIIQMKFLNNTYVEFENITTKLKEQIQYDSSFSNKYRFFVKTAGTGDEWEIVNE